MKHTLSIIPATLLACFTLSVSSCNKSNDTTWIKHSIDNATIQVLACAEKNADSGLIPIAAKTKYSQKEFDWQMGKPMADSYDPKDVSKDGDIKLGAPRDWRSGFFAGSLWYLYELTGNADCKEQAIRYTNILEPIRRITSTHDLGFMSMCSYGNAIRLAPSDTLKDVLVGIADNLCTRFNDTIKCIQSWNKNDRWNYPVIIDNMMNLNLLFKASELTGDNKYKDIATTHANTTIANHFREDYSTFHVVSYNDDGSIQMKCTHQGRSDDSSWSRGQAWGLYGYTETYANSGDKKYLEQAEKIASFIKSVNKTKDLVPIWDFNAPDDPQTPRDASAGAIIASGLLQLSTLVEDGSGYFKYAEKILKSLASAEYLAEVGTNHDFVLMHSVTSLPGKSEVNSPLNYADYYFLEAIQRYMKIKGLKYSDL